MSEEAKKEECGSTRVPFRIVAAGGVVSGAVLAVAFAPLSQGYFVFIALAPLLLLLRKAGVFSALFGGFLAGVAFFGIGLFWLAGPSIPGYLVTVAYQSLYFAAFAAAASWALRGNFTLRLFVVPAVWCFLEFLRARVPAIGIAYLQLAYPMADLGPFAQIADIAGAAGLSFAAVLTNACAAEMLASFFSGAGIGRAGRLVRFGVSAAAVAAVLAGMFVYGRHRLANLGEEESITVFIAQPNVPQIKKFSAEFENLNDRKLKELTQTDRRVEGVDLLIWPETSYFGTWPPVVKKEIDGEMVTVPRNDSASNTAKGYKVNFLVGAVERVPPGDDFEKQYNTAVYYGTDGVVAGKYRKRYRVPGGEYVFGFVKDYIPQARGLIPARVEYDAGDLGSPLFHSAGVDFGVLICYEMTFSRLVREAAAESHVTMLVNLSNEAWFKSSAELDQMHQIARIRAIEYRVGVVRATNSGISSIIGPSGRVAHVIADENGVTKEVEGFLKGRALITSDLSIFRKAGNVFLVFVVLLAAVLSAARASIMLFVSKDTGKPGAKEK